MFMELHGNCLTYLLAKFNYKKNKLGDVMLQKLRHVRFGRTSPERSSSIRCLATRMIDMFFYKNDRQFDYTNDRQFDCISPRKEMAKVSTGGVAAGSSSK